MDNFHDRELRPAKALKLLWLAAGIACLAGVFLAVRAERELRWGKARLAAIEDGRNALRTMEQDVNRYLDARRLFDGVAGRKAADLQDLLSSALPGVKTEDFRENYTELTEGWGLRGSDVLLNDALLSGAMTFAQEAERARPPWRLTKCLIRGGSVPGRGSVNMAFEALQKP